MSKLRSFRFPEEKLERLKEIAERRHKGNQTQAILEAIDRYHKELNLPMLQGYVLLDRAGNSDAQADCPGCNQADAKGSWIAVFSNGVVRGVLCDDCVEAGRF